MPHAPVRLQRVARVRQQEERLLADPVGLAQQVAADLAKCNQSQHALFDEIVAAADLPPADPKLYFIYASGGCGKTFLLNLLLRYFRSKGQIAGHVVGSTSPTYVRDIRHVV